MYEDVIYFVLDEFGVFNYIYLQLIKWMIFDMQEGMVVGLWIVDFILILYYIW